MDDKSIPAEKARQGRKGQRVLAILAIALALAGAVWLGLEFWGETIDGASVDQSGVSADQ